MASLVGGFARTAALALCLLTCATGVGAQPLPLESQVKAVYLLNFGKFATWPDAIADRQGFRLCVIGKDPFGPILDLAVKGEAIEGQQVIVKRVEKAQDAAGCRILFVAAADDRQLKDVLMAVGTAGVLTVGDVPQFVDHGGMIQFVVEDKKVRFQVNAAAVSRAGLALSSELLKVAAAIKAEPR